MKIVRPAAKSVNLEKLCRAVAGSDSNVQSVEVVSKPGLVLERVGSQRAPSNPRKNSELCHYEISLGEELDDLYGPIQYNFSEGDFATFTFPFEENLVVVTTTKNISPISIATKIAHIIIKFY